MPILIRYSCRYPPSIIVFVQKIKFRCDDIGIKSAQIRIFSLSFKADKRRNGSCFLRWLRWLRRFAPLEEQTAADSFV